MEMKNPTNLQQYLQGIENLREKCRQPLTYDQKQEFLAWCKNLNLDEIPKPCYKDYIKLLSYLDQQRKCLDCDGNLPQCSTKNIYVENGILKSVSAECPVRAAKKIIAAAQVPRLFAKCRFDTDFDIKYYGPDAIHDIVNSFVGRTSLYLWGNPGTGKTLLSSIIINERAYDQRRSHFYTVTDLISDLQDFSNPVRREEKLIKIQTTPCLIIDDLGAEHVTDWVSATLFNILNIRYKDNLQTVINSNFDIDSLARRYGGFHGERIYRRIFAMCEFVEMIDSGAPATA